MMTMSGISRRLRALALLSALCVLASGCSVPGSGSDEPSSAPSPTNDCGGDDDWCYSAYDFDFYCAIQETRKLIEQGDLTLEDLPDWAEEGELEDGSARIYDFRERTSDNRLGNALLLQLQDSVRESTGDGISWGEIRDCSAGLTGHEIAEREGGWPSVPGSSE